MRRFFALLVFTTFMASPACADIKLGVYGPLTGPAAPNSDFWKPALELAVADINAHGGVLGQKLVLVMMDDACDPRQSVAVMNKMIAEGVVALVGASCSGSILAASPLSDEAGLPQIVSIALNASISEKGWSTVFRMSGRDDVHARKAADYFIHKGGSPRHIAVIHDRSALCRGMADKVVAALNADGEKNVQTMDISPGEQDFTPILTRLADEKFTAVFISLYSREGGLFVRQAAARRLALTMAGPDTFSNREFSNIAGAAGDTVAIISTSLLSKVPAEFSEHVRAGGALPDPHTYINYAVIQVIASALSRAGEAKPDKLAVALKKGGFDTVVGPVTFNATGEWPVVATIRHWQYGRLVE